MKKISLRKDFNKIALKTAVVSASVCFLFLSGISIASAQCTDVSCPPAPYLLISKTVNISAVGPGDQIVYTITYANIGTADATNVTITDTFNYINQQYLAFVSANPAPTSGSSVWNVGTLAAGQSGQITITAVISGNPPVGTTEIKNRASIASTQTLSQSSNCVSVFVTKAGNPNLTITKSVSTATANAGDQITYTINYQNTGASNATNVIVADPFLGTNQNYLTFVSANPAPTSGNNVWNIPSLGVNETGQITIVAQIAATLPIGTISISNSATIDSDETYLVRSNIVTTTVSSNVTLVVSKTVRDVTLSGSFADSINAAPSDRLEFSIATTNNGNVAASTVSVKDLLPYQLIYVAGTTQIDGVAATDFNFSGVGINIGSLAPGQTKTVTFQVNVAGPTAFYTGNTTLTNQGGSMTPTMFYWVSDTATVIVTRSALPTLSITKSVSKTNVGPGDQIIYTLNYKNNGLGNATNVQINDPFTNLNQTYLTYVSANPAPTTGTNIWNVGTLAPGQAGQITITATINNSVPTGITEIRNVATIQSGETSVITGNSVSVFVNSTLTSQIKKLVRDVTKSSSFAASTTSDPGDTIEFQIQVTPTGTNSLTNAVVSDTLPGRLHYVTGSTTVNGTAAADGITSGGLSLGTLAGGTTVTIVFSATLDSASLFNVGNTILTNYSYLSADNFTTINNTATVNVTKPTGCSPSIQINKLAKNITQGSGVYSDSITAKAGDEIEFSIRITSVGNETAKNSRVRDQVPSNLTYITGSTTVDGISKNDDITTASGLAMGDLYVGASREIRFRARVNSFSNSTSFTITNTAYAWADHTCSNISDNAQLILSNGQVQTPSISITKTGRDITKNQTQFLNSFMADPGDQVEFTIQVSNTGNTSATNVKIWDSLPNNISIISGSTTVDGATWGGDVIGAGLGLGTINSGQVRTIRFRGTVASANNFAAGSTTLVNTAFMSSDNMPQKSDQTSIIIYRQGEVLGVGTVQTGSDYMIIALMSMFSAFIAFMAYCRIREEKLLEDLASGKCGKLYRALINFYFRTKLALKLVSLKLKKIRA